LHIGSQHTYIPNLTNVSYQFAFLLDAALETVANETYLEVLDKRGPGVCEDSDFAAPIEPNLTTDEFVKMFKETASRIEYYSFAATFAVRVELIFAVR